MSLGKLGKKDNLWENLYEIQIITGMDDFVFAKFLEISPERLSSLKIRKKEFPLDLAFVLSKKLNFCLENLAYGKLDFMALLKAFQKDCNYLPEKYSTAAFAKIRSSLGILKYIDEKYGPHVKFSILRKMQVPYKLFENPDMPSNVHFYADIFGELSK
jgi:hypothetical protein